LYFLIPSFIDQGYVKTEIYDLKNNLYYDVLKEPTNNIRCYSQKLNAQFNVFEIDPFKEAKFLDYQVFNSTLTTVIGNIRYPSRMDAEFFNIAFDAYSEASVYIEYHMAGNEQIGAHVTKYIEGEQPDYVFNPPKGLECKHFEGTRMKTRGFFSF
jgi:ATP-dependent protease Clp ATPase subunit